MSFSEKQEALVKEAWEIMKEDIHDLSLYYITQVFEIAPEAKGFFSFMKDAEDIPPQDNPKLKAHAINTLKMMCKAAVQLREKGEVVIYNSTLKHLGSRHFQYGVTDYSFEVVKEALLRTVEKGVGEKWSEEMKGAWSDAYNALADAIKAEMKKEAEKTQT